jgi:hypothetical protein
MKTKPTRAFSNVEVITVIAIIAVVFLAIVGNMGGCSPSSAATITVKRLEMAEGHCNVVTTTGQMLEVMPVTDNFPAASELYAKLDEGCTYEVMVAPAVGMQSLPRLTAVTSVVGCPAKP